MSSECRRVNGTGVSVSTAVRVCECDSPHSPRGWAQLCACGSQRATVRACKSHVTVRACKCSRDSQCESVSAGGSARVSVSLTARASLGCSEPSVTPQRPQPPGAGSPRSALSPGGALSPHRPAVRLTTPRAGPGRTLTSPIHRLAAILLSQNRRGFSGAAVSSPGSARSRLTPGARPAPAAPLPPPPPPRRPSGGESGAPAATGARGGDSAPCRQEERGRAEGWGGGSRGSVWGLGAFRGREIAAAGGGGELWEEGLELQGEREEV